jgi:hypothetical protein
MIQTVEHNIDQLFQRVRQLGAQWRTIHGEVYQLHAPLGGYPNAYAATRPDNYRVFAVSPRTGAAGPYPWLSQAPLPRVYAAPLRFVTADEVVAAVATAFLYEGDRIDDMALEAAAMYAASGLIDLHRFKQRLAELLSSKVNDAAAEALISDLRGDTSFNHGSRELWKLLARGIAMLVDDRVQAYRNTQGW